MTLLLVAPNAPSAALSEAVRVATPGEVSAEVVIVGTGAGGAVAARELARAGKRVLLLEAGGAFSQRDFQKKSLAWSTTHIYAQHGPQVATGDARMLIPQGRTLGGSTVLNEAICLPPPAARLHEWALAVGDPRLEADSLAPYVDEIWKLIGVTATHEGIGRRNNAIFRDGVENLARVDKDLRHGWMLRNSPTCLGCGVCHLGCPSGAKASVDKSVLPDAVNHGAQILVRCRAEGLIVEGGRVTGVEAVAVDPATDRRTGKVRVKADLVILAGSALGSPLLLERSGVGGPEVGRNFSMHPGIGVFAEMREDVNMWSGVPQGYYAHLENDPRFILETQGLGLQELYPLLGRAGDPGAVKDFRRLALAGAMVRDRGGGVVKLSDSDDAPFVPSIKVRLHEEDMQAFRDGAKAIVRVWFAAGAARVAPFAVPFRFYDNERDAFEAIEGIRTPADMLQVHASHPMGTCRMGPPDGPNRGVVDGNGKVHGVDGLYVLDGSIFPSAVGVNPQVTIMSLSSMLARRLAT
jgi:choline dehydrogenase-like flavoprotein